MASGGWIGNLVSGILNWGSKRYSVSSTVQPSVTAADLVPSTEAQTADAPVMGSETDTAVDKKKKRGLSSLYVKSTNSGTGSSSDYTGRSGL